MQSYGLKLEVSSTMIILLLTKWVLSDLCRYLKNKLLAPVPEFAWLNKQHTQEAIKFKETYETLAQIEKEQINS